MDVVRCLSWVGVLALLLIPGLQAGERVVAGTQVEAQGTVSFRVKFPEELKPDGSLKNQERGRVVPLVVSPLFSVTAEEKRHVVSLRYEVHRPGREPVGMEVFLSRLKAGQWYHFSFTWDTANGLLAFWLNGVKQEEPCLDISQLWRQGVPDRKGEVVLGGEGSGLEIEAADLRAEAVTGESLPGDLAAEAVKTPALEGEGRTLYDAPIDLSGYGKTLIYEQDFRQPVRVLEEAGAAGAGEDEWVLEGNGVAEQKDGSLILRTNEKVVPPHFDGEREVSGGGGHLVLWLNRRFPDGILVEYSIEPFDPNLGLHILFFSASHPGGGSIFPQGLKPRNGVFSRYILSPSEFLAYHISLFGAPRGTANLRKDGTFTLLTVGDDRIGGGERRPYVVRLLKDGGTIQAEVDGRIVISYEDDGVENGPVFKDGFLGFRMMGHSGSLVLRDLKVWKLERKPPSP